MRKSFTKPSNEISEKNEPIWMPRGASISSRTTK